MWWKVPAFRISSFERRASKLIFDPNSHETVPTNMAKKWLCIQVFDCISRTTCLNFMVILKSWTQYGIKRNYSVFQQLNLEAIADVNFTSTSHTEVVARYNILPIEIKTLICEDSSLVYFHSLLKEFSLKLKLYIFILINFF